jgi:uncharacterized protein DUF3309
MCAGAQTNDSPPNSLAFEPFFQGIQKMSLGTILLIVLVLALVGVIPTWPHSRSWGYGPSGIVGLVVVVLLILLLMGRI